MIQFILIKLAFETFTAIVKKEFISRYFQKILNFQLCIMVLRILEARILRKLFQLLLLCTTLSTSQLNKVKSFGSCSQVNTETYSEPSQASKIELLQEYGSSHSFNRCSRKYAKSRKNTCDGDCALAQVLFENLAEIYLYILYSPLDIYLFKVNNGNFRTSHEVSLTLTVKDTRITSMTWKTLTSF